MTRYKERYLVDESGKRIGVFLDIADYEKILEELEELESIRAFDNAKAADDEVIGFEDAIVEIEQEDDLSSEKGVDYQKLRDLLKAGDWPEADLETARVMLKVAGREKEGYLNVPDIENFPCTDLRSIDRLWVKYSNGKFGFSVQKRIWESVGGKPRDGDYEIYKKFGDRVGWYEMKKDTWIELHDFTFSLGALGGHLPVGWLFRVVVGGVGWCGKRWRRSGDFWREDFGSSGCGVGGLRVTLRVSSLTWRLVNCNL
jgi:hypothetical protein